MNDDIRDRPDDHPGNSPDPELEGISDQDGPSGGWRRSVRRFLAHRMATISLALFVLLVLVAIFAPLVAPKDPNAQDMLNTLSANKGLLGTDDYGRDCFSRLIFGTRVSLMAAFWVILVSSGIGIPLGLAAGVRTGWLDACLSRVSDALQSVPGLIFALTVIAVLGPGLRNAMVAVGVVTIPRFFRVTRAATQEVVQETYIEASRALGCGNRRLLLRHVVPNVLTPLTVQIALTAGAAVTAEAGLSFLGLGVNPPTASWGSMLNSAATGSNMYRASYLIYAPGFMIAFLVGIFMFIGDGLRQALGTRQIAGAEGV